MFNIKEITKENKSMVISLLETQIEGLKEEMRDAEHGFLGNDNEDESHNQALQNQITSLQETLKLIKENG